MFRKRKIIISLIIVIILALYTNTVYAASISSDINGIDENKYPGIKNLIQSLQNNHPNWKFQIEYTGLDFNNTIMYECQGHGKSPINLSPANDKRYSGMWICPICGTKTYDSGNWHCASENAIRYMMDSRNSINESDIFQFLDLSYTDNSSISTTTDMVDINLTTENVEIIPDIDYGKLKEKYPNSIIQNRDGIEVNEGILGTGYKIVIDNNTYTIAKKGDVTGDGIVNIIDVVDILNFIKGNKELPQEGLVAGKIQGSGNPGIVDVVNILNHIKGNKAISIAISTTNSSGLADNVKNMAVSTSYLDDECVNAIISSANTYKINPLYLVARLKQEQGRGTSPLVTGAGQNGKYVGYYNLFNINATGNNAESVIKHGLEYAVSRSWNTKSASITGGVEIIANKYINKKQNTLYYQKFNVVGTTALYTHQYMQNILAAQSEGSTLRKTYLESDPGLTNQYVFTIPVYENMPSSICPRPDTNQSNNINIEEKTVSVNSSLKVRTAPSTNADVITSLSNGAKIKVIKVTPNEIDNHYWSLVVCEATGAYGYVANDYIK